MHIAKNNNMDNRNSSRGRRRRSERGKREGRKCGDPEGDGSETRRQKFTISHAIAPTKCHSRRQLEQQQRQQEAGGVQWRAGGSGASSQAPATADDNQKTDKSCNDADDDEDVHELVSVSVTCHMCVRCGNDLHRGVA